MRKLRQYFFVILLLGNYWDAIAQDFPELQFEHITTKDGLSSDAVSAIIEDKPGFLWIGTANGLNRYDGYRFRQYYHNDADSNSIINNEIQELYYDSKGRIWITTEDGISCFLPGQNRFINYNSKFSLPYRLKSNSSARIYEGENGDIWICNQDNVIYRVSDNYTLEQRELTMPAFISSDLQWRGLFNIFRDKEGREWGHMQNRIYLLDKKTKQAIQTFDFSATINSPILKIGQDNDGNLWAGTWNNGLYRFFPDQHKLSQVSTIPKRIIANCIEWKFREQQWLACVEINRGLYLLDRKSLSSHSYVFVSGDPSSLVGSNFNALYTDRKNNLWICSNRGLQKVTSQEKVFDILPVTAPGETNYEVLKAAGVFSFFETDSSLWLSKRFVTTLEYDQDFKLKNIYQRLYPLSSSAYDDQLVAYYFFPKGNELFISTDTGLVVLDTKKRTSQLYFPRQYGTQADLRTIIPLKNDEIMIRSYGNGLFVFNTLLKKYTRHYSAADICGSCRNTQITYLFKTKSNEIFFCVNGDGLYRYDENAGSFLKIIPVNEKVYNTGSSTFYGMDEDEHSNLWITSKDGIFIYNPKENKIEKHITEKGQLGNVQRVCFDNEQNAWANGGSGIWCYLRDKDKWINFNSQDGLPGSDFTNILAKRKNGDIIAGLEGAIAIFHPQRLKKVISEERVVITEAGVGDQLYPFSLAVTTDQKQVTIHPGQNSFSIDFALLDYMNTAANRYYYKLEPLMKDFAVNKDGHINFNGLAPGNYTLYVKGGDKAGNIYASEDVLKIIVQPRWYQTGFFKVFMGVLVLALIFVFAQRRIAAVRRQSAFKQKMAETEMQALRAQMNPHFIFNSLNSIENFIMQNEKRLASDYLNKFAQLIRMILDSSRNELVPVAKDMEALQLYIDLEQLRFNNKFSYKTIIDPALLNGDYRVPSLLIQPYVENAIVHGLAHSEDSGLNLTVTATLENDKIKYVIQDNGIGREKAKEYNKRNKPYHKSVGLKITEDRINIFNKQAEKNGSILFTDLVDENKIPHGTKVEITIKAA